MGDDEADTAEENERRARARRDGDRAEKRVRPVRAPGGAAGCGRGSGGGLSERDRAWIAASVGALPPPTDEEIVGWCDILARLDGEHHRHSDSHGDGRGGAE